MMIVDFLRLLLGNEFEKGGMFQELGENVFTWNVLGWIYNDTMMF